MIDLISNFARSEGQVQVFVQLKRFVLRFRKKVVMKLRNWAEVGNVHQKEM